MNISISGSKTVPAGTYETIRISGSGKLQGSVICENFSTMGTSRIEQIQCKNSFKISGECSVSHQLKAKTIGVSGELRCSGKMLAEALDCTGSLECNGKIQCSRLRISGELTCNSDIEAETAEIAGQVHCDGLLNAETITIRSSGNTIGSIGGSTILIARGAWFKKVSDFLPGFAKIAGGKTNVLNGIEGDEITIDYVHTPRVSGRIVTIGDGCKIDLVQYSEKLEISPKAKVGKTEKI